MVANYPRRDAIKELVGVLSEPLNSNTYWNLQIAATVPDASLAEPIADLLPELDVDCRWAAVTALEAIGDTISRLHLELWLPKETDEELRRMLTEAPSEL